MLRNTAFAVIYDESFHPRSGGDSRMDLAAFSQDRIWLFSGIEGLWRLRRDWIWGAFGLKDRFYNDLAARRPGFQQKMRIFSAFLKKEGWKGDRPKGKSVC